MQSRARYYGLGCWPCLSRRAFCRRPIWRTLGMAGSGSGSTVSCIPPGISSSFRRAPTSNPALRIQRPRSFTQGMGMSSYSPLPPGWYRASTRTRAGWLAHVKLAFGKFGIRGVRPGTVHGGPPTRGSLAGWRGSREAENRCNLRRDVFPRGCCISPPTRRMTSIFNWLQWSFSGSERTPCVGAKLSSNCFSLEFGSLQLSLTTVMPRFA